MYLSIRNKNINSQVACDIKEWGQEDDREKKRKILRKKKDIITMNLFGPLTSSTF